MELFEICGYFWMNEFLTALGWKMLAIKYRFFWCPLRPNWSIIRVLEDPRKFDFKSILLQARQNITLYPTMQLE